MESEIAELNEVVDKLVLQQRETEAENEELVNQLGDMIVEAREARRSFTAFQIAVSILIFVYGMLYGRYSC